MDFAHPWWPVKVKHPSTILLDFGGPNIAKALHVGHLRSLVIGESLRRIFTIRGYDVISDIHLGDWGLPMGMLIGGLIHKYPNVAAFSVHGNEPIPENLAEQLEVMYPEVVAECKANPARMDEAKQIVSILHQKTNPEWNDPFAEDYKLAWKAIRNASISKIVTNIDRLGTQFTRWNGESTVNDLLTELIDDIEDFTKIDAGATVIDVALPTDKKPMPPLIFKKSDDGYTYAATDLATIWDRLSDGLTKIIYVVDNRQSLHFEQLFRAIKLILPSIKTDLIHAGFGTINGTDNKPYKTRDGGVPTLDWMLDTVVAKAKERTSDPKDAEIIGIGAIKFADLITNRESGYVFDIDRIMALEGKTGPYLQYAAVRLQHILNKVDTSPSRLGGPIEITCEAERDLLLTCANFPEILELAERNLAPNYIAEYAYTLAEKFSTFYKSCYVVDYGVVNKSRVEICLVAQGYLKVCLDLLGIEIPGAM